MFPWGSSRSEVWPVLSQLTTTGGSNNLCLYEHIRMDMYYMQSYRHDIYLKYSNNNSSCHFMFVYIHVYQVFIYIYIFLYTNENGKATHSPEPSNQSHVVFTWNGKPRSHEETSSKAAHLPNIPTNKITSIYSICRLSHQVEKSIYGPWIWEFFFFC